MKEVIEVSIAGISFTFDSDAYKVMNEYLRKLEAGYAKHPDGREIVADIEARVAELILEHQESDKVIGRPLAEEIVRQMGYPDDMDSGEENPIEEFPRRFYRNPDGAKLAGICSGIGAYFKVDPVWIRLGIFAPLVLSLFGAPFGIWEFTGVWMSVFMMVVLVYFVLWIAVPMAKTPRQKLEMRGEKITADSIRQGFEDEASAMSGNEKSKKNASVWADIVYVIGKILQVFLKIILFFIAFVVGVTVIAVFVAIIAVIFGLNIAIGGITAATLGDMAGITPVGYIMLGLVVVIIPLFVLVYWLIKVIASSRTNRSFLTTIWIIWAIILVWFVALTFRNVDNIRYGVEDLIESMDDGRMEDYIERWEDDFFFEDDGEIRFESSVSRIRRVDGGPLTVEKRNGKTEMLVLPERSGTETYGREYGETPGDGDETTDNNNLNTEENGSYQ